MGGYPDEWDPRPTKNGLARNPRCRYRKTANGEPRSFHSKMAPMRTHRLLACDGDGMRGLISIEVLAKLEKELRSLTGKPTPMCILWMQSNSWTRFSKLGLRWPSAK